MALYRSSDYQTRFESVGRSVKEKFKTDLQDSGHGVHFGFTIRMSSAFFSPRKFQLSFKSISLSGQEKKIEIDFQDGGRGVHLIYPIGTIFSIFFYLKVTLILPTKLRVSWSGLE